MNCVITMLNACENEKAPYLDEIIDKRRDDVDVRPTYRFLGDADFKRISTDNKDGNLKLAFFDSKISKEEWDKARPSYFKYRFKHANQ